METKDNPTPSRREPIIMDAVITIDRKTGKTISKKIIGPSKMTWDKYAEGLILLMTHSSTIDEACQKFFAYQREIQAQQNQKDK